MTDTLKTGKRAFSFAHDCAMTKGEPELPGVLETSNEAFSFIPNHVTRKGGVWID